MRNLTAKELRRQDFVDNAIHSLLEALAGKELPWDIEAISAVRLAAQKYVCPAVNMTEREFYPWEGK